MITRRPLEAKQPFFSSFQLCSWSDCARLMECDLCAVGGLRGGAEANNWSRCQRFASLVTSLNFHVPRNTWLRMNNRWSRVSYYYCKCCVTAGWGSKGQIPYQIIIATCRAEAARGERGRGWRERAAQPAWRIRLVSIHLFL